MMEPVTNEGWPPLLKLDLALVVGIVALACVRASDPVVMSSGVAVAYVARLVASRVFPPAHGAGREIFILLLATLFGGFNDFNTVVLHGVYRYRVPDFFLQWTTVPVWMLVFWGLILRFAAGLYWHITGESPGRTPNDLYLPVLGGVNHGAGRMAFLLTVAVATRPAIFRFYEDPLLSWLPFALALAVTWVVLRPSRKVAFFAVIAVLFGTLAEAVLIQVAGLHEYRQGVLFGVPLWIILWWPLGIMVWSELAARLIAFVSLSKT